VSINQGGKGTWGNKVCNAAQAARERPAATTRSCGKPVTKKKLSNRGGGTERKRVMDPNREMMRRDKLPSLQAKGFELI